MQRWQNIFSSGLHRSLIRQLSIRYNTSSAQVNAETASKIHNEQRKTDKPVTSKMQFLAPDDKPIIPKYCIMDSNGTILNKDDLPNWSDDQAIKIYKDMTMLKIMDKRLYESQRQARISFYMTSQGEEAAQIGSAAALDPEDLIYPQYREPGVLLYRGYTLQQFIDQCMGNARGSCKGIQMPIHYGSKELNYVTVSSTVATQMPQAVGSAYAYKRANKGKCVVCFFGDGGTSEGDAHAAFNFASTLKVPILFICRNNGFAISTPSQDQYSGDGIASRGPGYGMIAIRVDGQDIFAVYNATKAARDIAVNQNQPVLIEAMLDRFGPHSTSDDSSAYRSEENVRAREKLNCPVGRFRRYLYARGCWNDEKEENWKLEADKMVLNEIEQCERVKRAPITTMFENVFDKVEPHLQRQRHECMQHVQQNQDVSFLARLSKHEKTTNN